MLHALMLSLLFAQTPAPALHLQAPDWAFLQRQIRGDITPTALVDAFLGQIDAESTPLASFANPFDDVGPDPFDDVELVDPAAQATEAQAALEINALLDALDGLVRP